MESAADTITFSTTRIQAGDEGRPVTTGTGFFFNFCRADDRGVPCLVTNKHVVQGHVRIEMLLRRGDEAGNAIAGPGFRVALGPYEDQWLPHPDPSVDLCVCPIGATLHQIEDRGEAPHLRLLDGELVPTAAQLESLTAVEDVTMVGHPVGLWDSLNILPVLRQGITATSVRRDYEGRPEFLIDAACFPGSSGSPVFLFNRGLFHADGRTFAGDRVLLLGVLYAGHEYTLEGEIRSVPIPTTQVPIARTSVPINLGVVVKSQRLLDFDELLPRWIESRTAGVGGG